MGDPIPVEKAFQLGCDRVVVILTKPERELRSHKKDEKLAAGVRKRYPAAAEKLYRRAQKYNESVALAQEYARQGKVLIIAPDDICGVDTLKKIRNHCSVSTIRDIHVRHANIDFAGHTNNKEYVRFMLNTYSVQELETRSIREMEVVYINQSYENDILTVRKGSFQNKDIISVQKEDKVIAKSEIVRSSYE